MFDLRPLGTTHPLRDSRRVLADVVDSRLEVRSPADGSVVGSVPACAVAEVAATVARVRAAQPAWEAAGPEGRREWLERYRDWLLDHDEELAGLLQQET